MVVLDAEMAMDDYGQLPSLDQLDALKTKRGRQNTTFTAVGYGLQQINPVFVQSDRVRMVAYPHLIQINTPGFTGDFSLLLSNNHSTGGTCFGDSGGPNFLGDSNVIAGVTSFGINGSCRCTGGEIASIVPTIWSSSPSSTSDPGYSLNEPMWAPPRWEGPTSAPCGARQVEWRRSDRRRSLCGL